MIVSNWKTVLLFVALVVGSSLIVYWNVHDDLAVNDYMQHFVRFVASCSHADIVKKLLDD